MAQATRFVGKVVGDDVVDPYRDRRVALAVPAEDGSWVEVQLEGDRARPTGEPLAAPGSALAELFELAAANGLDPAFPDPVRAEVEAWAASPGLDDPELEDLEGLPFVTIDNEGSRDLDQALLIERDGEGHRVRYAIADASFYIARHSALFTEALRRGASYYLPGYMVPMLPRELSEGLVSLNAEVPRRAVVFDMRLDAAGACVGTRVVRARIRSRAKLTYDGVQRFIDGMEPSWAGEDYATSLRLLREVGERRIADANARDVVSYRRRTVEVGLDDRRSFVIYGALRNDVERYNEQLSLLCNAEGARLLRDGGASRHVEPIYRVHPAPPEDRVRGFASELERIAAARGARWRWDRAGGQSLAAYVRALPWDGEDARLSRAIQRQAIVMNVRSTFQSAPGEHFGVGAEVYGRFSAPMREIVGVFLHGELVEQLRAAGEQDASLVEAVIDAANHARDLQRTLTERADRMALDALFERDQAQGTVRRGTVMGVTPAKVYVTLDEPPVDVKLYRRNMGGVRGLGLGDAIDLRVKGRDRSDRWILEPATGA
ncbi:MAG: RNB domain-containing ribonuclease [Sandaracinaceae bacterium]|nr:RNB domain-containing ribonuclease [Sandaracinaceae bacterium]